MEATRETKAYFDCNMRFFKPYANSSAVLDISFVALSCHWIWFVNLLLIFGHSGEKPRYGKNSCLIPDFPTGPRHVTLARRHLMTIPRPKPP
jgi:hypothetical protein